MKENVVSKIDKAQREINRLNSEIECLNEEKIHLEQLSPDCRLAIEIHEITCHSNHTDMCGWYYEIHNGIHDWSRGHHSSALQKAQSIIKMAEKNNIPVDILIESYKLLR